MGHKISLILILRHYVINIISIAMKSIEFCGFYHFCLGVMLMLSKWDYKHSHYELEKEHWCTKSCGRLQVDLVYFRRVIIKPSFCKLCDINILSSGRGGKFIYKFYLLGKICNRFLMTSTFFLGFSIEVHLAYEQTKTLLIHFTQWWPSFLYWNLVLVWSWLFCV